MARAGLKKVLKTVRGKRGTTRRAYWVKSAAPTHAKLKRADAGVSLGHSAGYLGSQLGAMAGSIHGARWGARQGFGLYGQIGTSVVGSHFGAGIGRTGGTMLGYNVARVTKMRESTERNLSNATRLAGHAVRAYNLFKTVEAIGQMVRRHRG